MKFWLRCFLAFFAGLTPLMGQHRPLLYDFTEIPQSLLLNPGAAHESQWYAGVPLLSGVSVRAGSSGITVHDLFADDGLDINDKIRDRAINGLRPGDEFSVTVQMELLSGGFRGKRRPDDFYSFGVYTEVDAISYWPRDLAILGWEGNADQLGRRFDLGHLKTRGEMLNVFHFGINRKVDERLVLGVRAKVFSGILQFQSTRNRGYFVTTEGENNLLANTLSSQMGLQSSGLDGLRRELSADGADPGAVLQEYLVRRGFLGGDLGFGADLGFTYALKPRLVLTGSLLDLGFLVHASDVRNFTLEGTATSEGVEIILPDALGGADSDYWQNLVDEIEALVPFEEDAKTYVSLRPTKLYASLRYNLGGTPPPKGPCDCDYRTSRPLREQPYSSAFGAQLFMVNRPRGPQAALTAFYQKRFCSALAVKATYTADKFSRANIGLGFNLQAGPLELYVLADNLLAYRNLANAHTASLQFGLNILSWGRN
jgi:hypothetical protein